MKDGIAQYRVSADNGVARVRTTLGQAAVFQTISEHLSDMVSVHAPSGEYLFVSTSAHRLFGWNALDLEGRSVEEFVHPDDRSRVCAHHAAHCTDGDIKPVRWRFRCAGGDWRWVETRSQAQRSVHGVEQVIAITRDVDEEQQALQALETLNAELRLLALTDPLTGLANMRAFEKQQAQLLAEWDRGAVSCLVLVDVDEFKTFNDAFGHPAGDACLRQVAEALKGASRQADLVARYGGEEFALLLPLTALAGGIRLAERVRQAVEGAPMLRRVTVSLGVAEVFPSATARSWLEVADQALYRAKRAGRNCVKAA